MGEIYLVSDLHLSHNQPFLYEPRGFTSVKDMNEAIVENWNSVVKPEDRVICLGDIMLNDDEDAIKYIKQLNGEICLIYGNHETLKRQERIHLELPEIIILGYAHQFKYKKLLIYLSHYPTLTANWDEKHFTQHVINFHGHCHSRTPWIKPDNPFMYDVGLDAHNCTPIHIEEAISDIRQRWMEVGQLPVSIKPNDTYPY